MTMKPFLIEEIHEDGHASARIVWDETFDEPEIHAARGAVLDILAGEIIVNVDELGSNSAEDLIEAHGWLIDQARMQYDRLTAELPEVDMDIGRPIAVPEEKAEQLP